MYKKKMLALFVGLQVKLIATCVFFSSATPAMGHEGSGHVCECVYVCVCVFRGSRPASGNLVLSFSLSSSGCNDHLAPPHQLTQL